MKRTLLMLLILMIAAGTLFAGGKKEAAKDEVEFIVWNQSEPQSLDWHQIEGVPEHRIYYSLGEGLVSSNPETAEPAPGVAESWEVDDSGLVYTFHLRKTTWSDGEPITAKTFVDSWLRVLNPETAAPYAWFPADVIAGAAEYNSGEAGADAVKIKAVDDYTFQVELVGAMPAIVSAFSHYAFAIVPIHAIEKKS